MLLGEKCTFIHSFICNVLYNVFYENIIIYGTRLDVRDKIRAEFLNVLYTIRGVSYSLYLGFWESADSPLEDCLGPRAKVYKRILNYLLFFGIPVTTSCSTK